MGFLALSAQTSQLTTCQHLSVNRKRPEEAARD